MIQSVLHHACFNILFFCFTCIIKQRAIMLFPFFQVVRCLRLLKKFDPNEFQLKSTASNYKFGKKRSGYQSSSGTSIRELYIWYDQCRRDKRYNTCWGTTRKPYIGATLWYYVFDWWYATLLSIYWCFYFSCYCNCVSSLVVHVLFHLHSLLILYYGYIA